MDVWTSERRCLPYCGFNVSNRQIHRGHYSKILLKQPGLRRWVKDNYNIMEFANGFAGFKFHTSLNQAGKMLLLRGYFDNIPD